MRVRVPASTANLGPGFDALGMALTLHLEAGTLDAGGPCDDTDDRHPAVRAYLGAGGQGRLWVRSGMPMGRGLGFSGAARVAGLLLAMAEQEGSSFDLAAHRDELLHEATELEGHADNVAASLLGGVVATAGGKALRVPLALEPAVIVWVPTATTSTRESRARLPVGVTFDDAVFNVTRTALLVAALATGDVGALRTATEDRLHQDVRFHAAEGSQEALAAALAAGAWCGWLSGSGPSIAGLCDPADVDAVTAALPGDGQVSALRIDADGAVFSAG